MPCPWRYSRKVGWGPGQPDLVHDLATGNPVHNKVIGSRPSRSVRSLPAQVILWFYDPDNHKDKWLFIDTQVSKAS